jgi:hypothetical protein
MKKKLFLVIISALFVVIFTVPALSWNGICYQKDMASVIYTSSTLYDYFFGVQRGYHTQFWKPTITIDNNQYSIVFKTNVVNTNFYDKKSYKSMILAMRPTQVTENNTTTLALEAQFIPKNIDDIALFFDPDKKNWEQALQKSSNLLLNAFSNGYIILFDNVVQNYLKIRVDNNDFFYYPDVIPQITIAAEVPVVAEEQPVPNEPTPPPAEEPKKDDGGINIDGSLDFGF